MTPISIPCGRCVGCRLEKARQWAVRIMHEAKCHQDSSFITLTFDDQHLGNLRSCISCRYLLPGLCVCICQSFLKKLRERIQPKELCWQRKKIRFFLAGEYGEKTGRPHYHAIIFGFGFPDKRRLKGEGERALYTSSLLSEVWGAGFASVGSVTFDSASYVANYAQKKVTGHASDGRSAQEIYGGRRPEFLLMSRRPGIGNSWFQRYRSDVYPRDEVIVRGRRARPPRYYDKLIADLDPVLFESIRGRRADVANTLEEYVDRSGVRHMVAPSRNAQRLAVREVCAKAKLAQKTRKLGD